MRRALLLALLAGTTLPAQTPRITAARYLEHVRALSEDGLGGRGNGTEGLERAADYVAARFRAAGLRGPAADTFDQPFEIDVRVEPPSSSTLQITSASGTRTLLLGRGYYPLSPIERRASDAPPRFGGTPVVFAGFGISAPGMGYDDFAGVDVADAAVLVFTHEPQEHDAESVFDGRNLTPAAAIAAKAREARQRGARMLLVVEDPSHAGDRAVRGAWWNDPQTEEMGLPVLRVAREQVEQAVPDLDLSRLATAIDRTLVPQSRRLAGVHVTYTEHRARLRARVRNVVGVLEGRDPALAREAILVGAHYDHVGTGGRFSEAPEATGETHNGADDNASGTAALIEIAGAAAASRSRYRRSIVFAAFAAEEIGLVGSRHYADQPVIPLADTRAMINLDMIGRARGRVMVGVFGPPGRFHNLVARLRPWTRLTIADFSNGGYRSGDSDEGSFASRGVPAIAFFTGFHADYHRPSDDWPLIDAEGGAEVARLALRLVEDLAR
jgi:hypothetical protein